MGFSDVLGQPAAVARLRATITRSRVPGGWLFVGPDGVGKRLAAEEVTQALLCDGESGEGCGECLPCRKYTAGGHLDVHTLSPEGAGRRIRIDAVRALCRDFSFPPREGGRRVVRVFDAERLQSEAANALLKNLEEPPEDTHFILVTHAADALLDTIRSRCQRVRFAPLPKETCARLLEREGLSPADAQAAAALGEGSVGRARQLWESGMLEDRSEMVESLAALSVSRPGQLFELAASWTAASVAAEARELLSKRLDLMGSWYRDLLVLSLGGQTLIHEDLRELACSFGFGRHASLGALDAIERARGALALNGGARLVAERLLIELAQVRN